jgi:hypothetical protein
MLAFPLRARLQLKNPPPTDWPDISRLDARERAKARSLLDPSDPSDVKAFSPPISDSDIRFLSFGCSPHPSALRFPNWDFRFRPLDLSPQLSAHPSTCDAAYLPWKIFRFAMLGDLLVVVLVLVSAFCADRISIIIVCLQCNRHPTRVYLFPPAENPPPTD